MKLICTLVITLCLALCAWPVCAASINGQTYVSVSDWASANGLHTVSQTHDRIVLAGSTSRLVLNTDSAEAEINGVNVRLSFPVANDHGAPVDLDPVRKLAEGRDIAIVEDAAHAVAATNTAPSPNRRSRNRLG